MLKKTFSISKLSKENWDKINACKDFQCGLTGWFARYIADVPKVYKKTFKYSCVLHDLGTRRGGSIFDFIKNNWTFVKLTALDILQYVKYSHLPTLNLFFKLIGLLLLWVFTIPLVFIIGLFVFSWGNQRHLDAILNKAKCND